MSRARDTANQINRVNSSAADATAITVDSSENVGIGTASPAGVLHANSSGHTKTYITSGTSNDAQINFGDSDDNDIGGIHYDNAQNAMKFLTNTSERIRIDSDGLKFNGDTAAANALSDYEEGTWTPSLGGNATYNFQRGFYTKVGRQVTLVFYIDVASIGTGSTSTITGQPFASTTFAPASGVISRFQSTAGSYVSASGQIGTSNIVIIGKTSASNSTGNISPFQNATAMYMTITYFTS